MFLSFLSMFCVVILQRPKIQQKVPRIDAVWTDGSLRPHTSGLFSPKPILLLCPIFAVVILLSWNKSFMWFTAVLCFLLAGQHMPSSLINRGETSALTQPPTFSLSPPRPSDLSAPEQWVQIFLFFTHASPIIMWNNMQDGVCVCVQWLVILCCGAFMCWEDVLGNGLMVFLAELRNL